jgi:hypothetical protein
MIFILTKGQWKYNADKRRQYFDLFYLNLTPKYLFWIIGEIIYN